MTLQQITVSVTEQVVTVSQRGVPGPPGSGTGTAFSFTQASPAATWTINHNLGYRPQCTVFDAGNNVILGEVQNPSVNQTVIQFAEPMAGTARLQ